MMTKQHSVRPRVLDRLERLPLNALPPYAAWIVALALLHGCGAVDGPAATGASHLSRSMTASPGANVAASLAQTFYGPEQFERTTGAPDQYTRSISTSGYIGPFALHVQSGAADGSARVTSGSVTLDGATLLGPSDFNKKTGGWDIPVALGGSATLQVNLQGKPGSYLDVWIEGQPAVRFCPDGAASSYGTLEAALAAAPDGGTVVVCDGTHIVSSVNVRRPVTIESEGPGIATLDGGSSGGALWIGGSPVPPSGTVILRRLRFTGGQWDNVSVGLNAGDVLVTRSEFSGALTAPDPSNPSRVSGLMVAGAGIGTVTVDSSTFIGNDIGVHVNSPSGTIVVRSSSFKGQSIESIHLSGPKPGPITVQDNSFSDCGLDWCLFTQLPLSVVGNTFTIDIARPTHSPMRLDVGVYGTEPAIVTDNVVVGTGSGGATRADLSEYPMQVGIQVYGAADMHGNRITNAYTGVWLSSATVSGTDNTIEHTFEPFGGGVTIAMTRNDLLDYVGWRTMSPIGTNLKCNWWGSTSGPSGITSSDSAYLPFATQPIANQPAVTCTP